MFWFPFLCVTEKEKNSQSRKQGCGTELNRAKGKSGIPISRHDHTVDLFQNDDGHEGSPRPDERDSLDSQEPENERFHQMV